MYFKDLTQVEQLEERERLRDRLASLGEMAAGIAHELKNPLAGIEVMAGLLRRKVPDSPDAQSLLADIISEAKLANAIVMQMLEFVRPIRLQVERNDMREVFHQAVTLAESKVPRGDVEVVIDIAAELPLVDADEHQLVSGLHQPADQRLRGARRTRPHHYQGGRGGVELDPAFATDGAAADAHAHRRCHRQRSRACRRSCATGFSIRSSRPSPRDPASVCRSCGRSSTRTTGGLISTSTPGLGTRFRVTLPVVNAASWFKYDRARGAPDRRTTTKGERNDGSNSHS